MKNSFFLFLIVVINYQLQAQKISIGIETGINIIPIENTDIGYNYQLGYHFGGHLKYNFSSSFKLSTGLFLTQKKKKYSFENTSSILTLFDNLLAFGASSGIDTSGLNTLLNTPGVNSNINEEVNGVVSELFIEIPVLANYKYKNLNFYLGPYAGLLISAQRKEKTRTTIPLLDVIDLSQIDSTGFISFLLPPSDETTVDQFNSKDNLRIIDIGINGGIGYEINNLHFNLMYSYGILGYRKDKNNAPLSTLKTVRLSIAYLFDIKEKDTEQNFYPE